MVTKYITFEVRRCVNTTENNNWCHPDYEIDEYLTSAAIEVWTIEKNVDMSNYYSEPSYMIQKLQVKYLLNREYT